MTDATQPVAGGRTGPAKTRPSPLHAYLRNGEVIAGLAAIPTPQSLRAFLTTRRGGVLPLTDVRGKTDATPATHVVLRLASVLYVWSTDTTLRSDHPLPGVVQRRVRLSFDDRTTLDGVVAVPASQPISDFFGRAEEFIILRGVPHPTEARVEIDVAVHVDAIIMVRDLGGSATAEPMTERVVQRRNSQMRLVAFPDA